MSPSRLPSLEVESPSPKGRGRFQGLLLATVVALVAIIWLAYLPRLAQGPEFVEEFTRIESQGIDPGALFYTDHPRALNEP